MTNLRCQSVTYTAGVPTYGAEIPSADYEGLTAETLVNICEGLVSSCFKGLSISSTDSDPCGFDFTLSVVCRNGRLAIDTVPYEFPDPDLYAETGMTYSVDDPTAEYVYEEEELRVCDTGDPSYGYSKFTNLATEWVAVNGSPPPDYSGTRMLFDLILECGTPP